jgi:hypothetical protein
MTSLSGRDVGTPQNGEAPPKVYLTPKKTSGISGMSTSWLAKARMNGGGPPYFKFGRAVRYEETTLHQWVKTRERHSTSEDCAKKRPEFTE